MIPEISAGYLVDFLPSDLLKVGIDAKNCENEDTDQCRDGKTERQMDIYVFMWEGDV